jgi:FKBP-type peptidyl-prolyl cis-trans isomerase FkpA
MSVAEAAHRPARTGRAVGLWIGFLILIAGAIGLAWAGAGSLRPTITASGLHFRTVKAGTGDPITPNDAALMDYILTVNGKVVDASENHGGPQPFAVGTTFPGFGEAMTHMQEGGIYRFTMPPSLAFPNGHAPQGFPGGDLTFDVQVRKVVRGGAAMLMQGGGPPPGNPAQ